MKAGKTLWLGGWHTVSAIARHQPHRLRRVLLTEGKSSGRRKLLVSRLKALGIKPETVALDELNRLVEGVHQGVAALCEEAIEGTEAELFDYLETLTKPPLLLLLDGIQDPRNLGACLRIADAAGCDAVILEKRNSAPLSALAQKAASGACLSPYRVPGLVRVVNRLKQMNVWIYGADPAADTSLYLASLHGPIGWVVGSEGSGLRPLLRKSCDQLVHIPMAGAVSSLNLSVATGICLFETRRQQSDR